MTYAEAVTLRSALEAPLLSGAGMTSVQIGDRSITYQTAGQAQKALAEVNRSILAYERRQANLNPSISRPSWN